MNNINITTSNIFAPISKTGKIGRNPEFNQRVTRLAVRWEQEEIGKNRKQSWFTEWLLAVAQRKHEQEETGSNLPPELVERRK